MIAGQNAKYIASSLAGYKKGDRKQVVELEDEADVGRPPRGQLFGAHPGNLLSVDDDTAAGRRVEAGEDVEQGRLAAARRPHQRQKFARFDVEIDAFEHPNLLGAPPIGFGEAANFDQITCWG